MTRRPPTCPISRRVADVLRQWFAPATLVVGALICALALGRMLDQNTVEIRLEAQHLAVAALAAVASLMFSARAWQALLEAVSGRRISYREAFSQVGLILAGKYVPGKVSGIAARIVANSSTIPARQIVIATLLEQGGGMASALAIGGAAFIVVDSPVIAVGVTGAAVLAMFFGPSLLAWAFNRWPRLTGGALPPVLRIRALRAALALQTLQWVALALLVCAVAGMVDSSHGVDNLLRIAGAYALAVVVGQLAIVFPGGIGPREGAFVWFLSGLAATPQVLAIALALRVATTGIDLLGTFGYLTRGLRSIVDTCERNRS